MNTAEVVVESLLDSTDLREPRDLLLPGLMSRLSVRAANAVLNFLHWNNLDNVSEDEKMVALEAAFQSGSAMKERNMGWKTYSEICHVLGVSPNLRCQSKSLPTKMRMKPRLSGWWPRDAGD